MTHDDDNGGWGRALCEVDLIDNRNGIFVTALFFATDSTTHRRIAIEPEMLIFPLSFRVINGESNWFQRQAHTVGFDTTRKREWGEEKSPHTNHFRLRFYDSSKQQSGTKPAAETMFVSCIGWKWGIPHFFSSQAQIAFFCGEFSLYSFLWKFLIKEIGEHVVVRRRW